MAVMFPRWSRPGTRWSAGVGRSTALEAALRMQEKSATHALRLRDNEALKNGSNADCQSGSGEA
jgi:hypothetical protein